MKQTDEISKIKMACEETAEQAIKKLIETIGTVHPNERAKIYDDLKLPDDEKLQILTKMDKFENIFREKIWSQKENFISALQDFCEASPSNDEAKAAFIIKTMENYAVNILVEEIDVHHRKIFLPLT